MTEALARWFDPGNWLVWRETDCSVSLTCPTTKADGLIEVKMFFASADAAAEYEAKLKELYDTAKGNLNLTVNVGPA